MIEFPRVWSATDLGELRPAGAFTTYAGWPYETLPSLRPERRDGFAWAGDAATSAPDAERLAELETLARSLPPGIALPESFVRYMSRPALTALLDEVSTTACRTDLSDVIASPVEEGAHLVRFFRDQQDCVFWYLYLRPNGESFVVDSEWSERFADAEGRPEFFWSAPTIEEFTYRYWLECKCWYVLSDYFEGEETPEVVAYLSHYGEKVPTGE
ncbi:hypothetical protein AB0I28_15355 [Phytomonospora sp. NPDC050363]|uniref:hypothetical protein n=1 Tax=Phytomonospora sp. NPDC050363 TaxID=3155642 RepID=UPI0033CAE1B8